MKLLIVVFIILSIILSGCIESTPESGFDVKQDDVKIDLQIVNISMRHSEAHLLDRASDYISIVYIDNKGEIATHDITGIPTFVDRHIYLTNSTKGNMTWYYHSSSNALYRIDIYIPKDFYN